MKKVLVYFFIWFIYSMGCNHAQIIKFELYLADNCTDTIGRIDFYTLMKDSVSYYPKNNDGITYLPDTGEYILSTIFDDEIIVYDIKNRESIIDTIESKTIQFCLEPTTRVAFSGYCCCGVPCEGKQVDYYHNGNKRIEGVFNRGKTTGKMIFYKRDGSIDYIEKYSKKGKFKKKTKY